MQFDVVTLFPEMFAALTQSGVTRRAFEQNKCGLSLWNPRDFTTDNHRTVDDRPYGGGPGMVMQAEPLAKAIAAAKAAAGGAAVPVLMMSPQGERFSQAWAARLAASQGFVVVCGRYEGIDERFMQQEIDVELSLGDFVLSGGELAAMAVVDAVARLLPGVLGDAESAVADSFSNGLLDHPHYTKPLAWQGQAVPEVLLGGNHKAIAEWRLKQALKATWLKRPDLLAGLDLNAVHRRLLREAMQEHLAATIDG